MADIATLGIRIEGSEILTATTQLDALTAAGARAEGGTRRLSVAAQQYAWAQKQGFRPDVLEAYRRSAEGAALGTSRLAASAGDMTTTLGRTVPMTAATVAPMAAVATQSLRTERAVSRVAMSMAMMAQSGAIGTRSLRGMGMGMMMMLPGMGWWIVGAMAAVAALNLLAQAAGKSDEKWKKYRETLTVARSGLDPVEKIKALTAAIDELRAHSERAPSEMGWFARLVATLKGTAADPGAGMRLATERMAAQLATDRALSQARMAQGARGREGAALPGWAVTLFTEDQVRAGNRAVASLRAANDAFGQTEHAIRLVAIEQERLTERQRNAVGVSDAEAAALNVVTDAMAQQKVRAEELAETRRATMLANAGIESAQREQSMAWFEERRHQWEEEKTKLAELAEVNLRMGDAIRDLAQRGVEAAKATAAAWDETVQSIKAAAREMKEGATQGWRDVAGALPTIGGINLASLVLTPKTYALDLFAKALDNIFNGAARAATALRAFALSMESFRAAAMGDTLAQQIAAVRQQAQGLREALVATIHGPRDYERLMAGLKTIGELEEKWVQQLRDEAAALTTLEKSNVLKDIIAGLTGTITTLRDYAASLKLGPSSILNPMAQYAEARRQYDVVLAAAQGGDQEAAGRLPAAAQAFLDASRAVNASSVAYARDYAAVQAAVEAVAAAFEAQRSIAQQSLDALLGIERNTATLPSWGTEGGSIPVEPRRRWDRGEGEVPDVIGPVLATGFETVSAVSVAGFQEVVARLDSLTAQVVALTGQTRQTGENLAVT